MAKKNTTKKTAQRTPEPKELTEQQVKSLALQLTGHGETKDAEALLVLMEEIERDPGMFTTFYVKEVCMRSIDEAMFNHAALVRERLLGKGASV